MARYFFDVHDGKFMLDDVGLECADFDAVRREAKRVLPDIALEVLPEDGDHHTLTVRVRDEQHETVYTATLAFNGVVMIDRYQAHFGTSEPDSL